MQAPTCLHVVACCTQLIDKASLLPPVNQTFVKVDPVKQATQNAELDLMAQKQAAKRREICRCGHTVCSAAYMRLNLYRTQSAW